LEHFKSHQRIMAKDEEKVQPRLHKNKPAADLKKKR